MVKWIYNSSRFRNKVGKYEKLTKTTIGWVWKKIREVQYIIELSYELKRLDEYRKKEEKEYKSAVEYLNRNI